ncbi:MAG: uroporphyrinogen-III C-methyltransferase [Akkermansia sp.]
MTSPLAQVYLVGAGPGDPDLLTVKGLRLLSQADCIVYDALASPAHLAQAKEGCELINVGKRAGQHAMPQADINDLLVSCASQYKLTVRLKGGDPYIFGRGGEEALYLAAAAVRFEVVPGISSAIAGPAYAGIPVTQRGMCTQFTVFTGHEMPGKSETMLDIAGIAAAQGTKIMLMGMSQLDETLKSLIAAGQAADCPAAAVQWAATSRQKKVVATVATLAKAVQQAQLGAPAIVIIGEVVTLNQQLNWYEQLPLIGKRIVVTRTREQASKLSQALHGFGADVLELPTIRIVAPSNRMEFAESVVDSPRYDWLIFSSPNGVKRFMQAFFAVYDDIREIGGARIAAVGPATAKELKKHGLMVDVMPQKAVAEELIAEFDRKGDEFSGIEHSSMLWIHSEQGRDIIMRELMKRKAIVDECIAYNTIAADEQNSPAAAALKNEGAELITFTSSSTVKNFMAMKMPLPPNCLIASIGPITTQTLAEYGLHPHIEAAEHHIDSLVDAILEYFKKK